MDAAQFEQRYGLSRSRGIHQLIDDKGSGKVTEAQFEQFVREIGEATNMDLIGFEEKYHLPECIARGVFQELNTKHDGRVTHEEFVAFTRKVRDADNSAIAKIFVAITKRDQEPDLSRSEIETILNGKMNTDVAERLLDVIFHGARDKIPTEEFVQLLDAVYKKAAPEHRALGLVQ